MYIKEVTSAHELAEGDRLILESINRFPNGEKIKIIKVKDIYIQRIGNTGDNDEDLQVEVIWNKKQNKFFNLSAYLKGGMKSELVSVHRIVEGKEMSDACGDDLKPEEEPVIKSSEPNYSTDTKFPIEEETVESEPVEDIVVKKEKPKRGKYKKPKSELDEVCEDDMIPEEESVVREKGGGIP